MSEKITEHIEELKEILEEGMKERGKILCVLDKHEVPNINNIIKDEALKRKNQAVAFAIKILEETNQKKKSHRKKEGGETKMKITDFAKEVTKYEALKKQVNIAQILEILKVINLLLKKKAEIDFYRIIRTLK